MTDMRMRAIMVAGTSSGCGKTTTAMVLMHALRSKGFSVAPFKAGPDYIDPSYHSSVCSQNSANLDLWLTPEETVRSIFNKRTAPDKFGVIEGVMGLYDGAAGTDGMYSSAHLAKTLDVPVILVIDGSRMGDSVAAIALGFVNYDPDVKIAGIIFNNVSSDRHYEILRKAVGRLSLRSFGYLPRGSEIAIEERHLGLKSVHEQDSDFMFRLKLFADTAAKNIDIDGIVHHSKYNNGDVGPEKVELSVDPGYLSKENRVKIAVARDEAFCFYYEDSLDALRCEGAELVYFSPLNDEALPGDISGIILGGGFPEMFAEALSDNSCLLEDIRFKVSQGMPVYAECGGLLYAAKEFISGDGRNHEMANLINVSVKMNSQRVSLGYVEAKLENDCLIGSKGTVFRGHKFHWSSAMALDPLDGAYSVSKNSSSLVLDGYVKNNVFASYVHLHFSGCPGAARTFISTCREFSKQGVTL